jgi:hypothetical protein
MVRVKVAFACLAVLAACHSGNRQNEAAASGTTHFVNSPDNARSMALRDAYVDFSFDYPARWSVTPQPIDGTAQNYVRVAAPLVNGYEPYAFLVGFASGTGNGARDRASLPGATRDLATRFGAGLQNYQIVATGPGRISGFDSYGWRFTATGPGAEGEPPVQIYGRGDLILPPGAARGVVLVSLATSRAGDVHGAAEVGEGGPLKAILDSFHLVASNAAPPPPSLATPPPDRRSALENETSTSPPVAIPPEAHPRATPATTPARPAPTTPPAARPSAPAAPPAATPALPPAAHPAPTAPPAAAAPAQPSPAPPREPPAGNGQ